MVSDFQLSTEKRVWGGTLNISKPSVGYGQGVIAEKTTNIYEYYYNYVGLHFTSPQY